MLRRTKKRSALSKNWPDPASIPTAEITGRFEEPEESDEEEDSQLDNRDTLRTKTQKRPKTEAVIVGLTPQNVDPEEALLEKEVLGNQQSFVENLKRTDSKRDVGVLDAEKRKPAWVDDEDEDIPSENQEVGSRKASKPVQSGTVFSQKRKTQFEKAVGSTPSWAELPSKRKADSQGIDSEGDSDDDEEEQFLRQTGDYLTTSDLLPKSYLNIRKVPNANQQQYTKGKLSAMEFHPTSQVMLTAGSDTSLHIFQVDGKQNPKIQTVSLESYPILNAHFSADGSEVIMTSRSRWFYVYDMIAGKIQRISCLKEYQERQPLIDFTVSPDGSLVAFQGLYGFIHLVTAKNKELIASLKMNGSVTSLAFSSDGSRLFSFGDDGEVYIWNVRTRDCIHKFVDDGCIRGKTVNISRNGKFLACGSDSGVVNIYDSSTCLAETRPQPIKAIMNLTTAVTEAKFNGSSEILAAASFHTKAAVKLIHLPDCHIFPNFPFSAESIGSPTLVDFSPNSGYMAVGNDRGKALLYRLGHYKDY